MSSRQSTRNTPKRAAATSSKASAPTAAETSGSTNNETVDSRRQKKRELDRRCQRMARERTKARIAYLEGLVEDFRQQDASGRVASLMKQLQDTAKERDELAKTLKLIENSIRGHGLPGNENSELKQEDDAGNDVQVVELTGKGKLRTNSIAFDSASMPPPSLPTNDEALGSSPEAEMALDITTESLPDMTDEGVDMRSDFIPYIGEDQDPIYPPSKGSCDCYRAKSTPSFGAPMNMWRFANETLAKQETYDDDIMEMEDAFSDDVPVRALIEGWDAVEMRLGGVLPPMWKRLRKIDEVIFGTCANTERLAIMRVMHLLLKYHAQPTQARKNALPAWYLKRPSQTLAHSYAIDFFAWPGLRERFVFGQHRYCTNLFWHLFCRSLHVVWPFEFRDTYTYNTLTREYKVSASFEERIHDINAWTMARDIFRRWPEFYSDFPTWGHLPMSLAMGSNTSARPLNALEDKKRATTTAHRGSVASITSVATPTASPGSSRQGQARSHIVRTHSSASIDHRGPAVEGNEDDIEEVNRRDSASTAPVEVPANLFSLQGFSDWWAPPFQFAHAQHHGHGFGHKSTDFVMPVTNVPQETLNTLSQMYDLPI